MVRRNLELVNNRISEACRSADRPRESVQLLAVSKTKPADLILDAIACGQRHFGENYLQDAMPKIQEIGSAGVWHFIGSIQSNKTRPIAEHFDWVHTVSSIKVARRLNDQRPKSKGPLKIFLQINIDDDANKSGFEPAELPGVLDALIGFKGLELQGLMTLPTQRNDPATQQLPFKHLRQLQQACCPHHLELSMGMSRDLEAAILEGATWVRIGTDIFGMRDTL